MLEVSAGFEGVNLFAKAGTTVEGRAGRVPLRSLLLIDLLYFICLILGFFLFQTFFGSPVYVLKVKKRREERKKVWGLEERRKN